MTNNLRIDRSFSRSISCVQALYCVNYWHCNWHINVSVFVHSTLLKDHLLDDHIIYNTLQQDWSIGQCSIYCTCKVIYLYPGVYIRFDVSFFFVFFLFFLAFDFFRFCVVILFFHPRHNGQWPPTTKDFLSQIVSITFIILSSFLRKSQYFPFWMFSAKQGHYWC